jgi:hypothetical protein
MKSFSANNLKNLFLSKKLNHNLLFKSQMKFFGSGGDHHHHEITGEVDKEKIYVKNSKDVKEIK